MSIQETVVGIVKNYFDNAVIIDDQLDYEHKVLPEIEDADLAFIPDDLDVIDTETGEQAAPATQLTPLKINQLNFFTS